jgi:hypothetical protein
VVAAVSDVALAHAPTRRRADGLRRTALALLVAGVAATLLGLAGLRAAGSEERALRETMQPARGRVEAVVPAGAMDTGRLIVRVDGQRAEVPADLERETWSPGDDVALLVAPGPDGVVRREDTPGDGSGGALVVLVLVGPVAAAVGAVAARRERRDRAVLAAHPWRVERGRVTARPGRVLRLVVVLAHGPHLRLDATPRWLLDTFRAPGSTTFWVAGPADGRQVVTTPGVPVLVGARPAEDAPEPT